ncbi:MAG: HPr family phosphocarrier protein [Candidatus Limnocylindria bacterium]
MPTTLVACGPERSASSGRRRRCATPEIELEIRNPSGLHARPAAAFVKAAAAFGSDIRLVNLSRDPARQVNAKSVLGLLAAGVAHGQRVRVSAEGPDASEALRALAELVESGVGEQVEPPAGSAPPAPAS